MSLTAFAEGLGAGLETGVRFGAAINEGKNVAGIRRANEVLAQMQTMGPIPVTPGNQGALPDPNQQAAPTGYDGLEWAEVKKQYMTALRGVTDPQMLLMAEKRVAELEKGKVLQYGQAAMQALDQGDLGKAQQYFAGLSYFMFPGETPIVQMGQDGTVFFQDSDGEGMALRKEQIADMLHQFTNFEDWRQLTFDKERHADDMAYRNTVLASQIQSKLIDQALDREELELDRAQKALENERTSVEIAALEAADLRATQKLESDLSKEALAQFRETRTEAQSAFQSLLDDPEALNAVLDQVAPVDEALNTVVEDPKVSEARARSVLPQMAESERQHYRSLLRHELDTDPRKRLAADALMTGLIAGGDVATAQEVATLAFATVFEPKGQSYFEYDPDSGTLRVGEPGNYNTYAIGVGQQATLNALLGTGPKELQAGAPTDGVLPIVGPQ